MDGVVQQGSSTLDQAPITGESSPVEAAGGSTVFAGSINGHGGLLVEVTKLAKDNTLSRIVQMVQEAQSRRAPAQRFVDTFARCYTPAVITLATGVAVLSPLLLALPFSTWFYRALVLLVIACPCALVISTPVAIVSAISNAARRGVLIKGGMHLEAIGRVHAVAFDKTGTLTEGKAAVTDVESVGPNDPLAEAADIVLMSDDLRHIPYVIRLGRRTLGRIRENIVLSLLIKGAFLLLAVGGFATLWMAVFADMGTSLIVTLNGMRLLREE